MLSYIVILGAIVSLIGCLSYIKETLKGTTRPNRISWLLWSIAPLIATAAGIKSGVTWAAIPVFISGFGPLIILCSTFFNKRSYWKLERFDYLCGLFSLLALILWGITRNPAVAIIFAMLSDAAAAIPTIKKSLRNPKTEAYAPYAGGMFSAGTAFFAIATWNFPTVAFPLYLVAINAALMGAIYYGGHRTQK